MARLHLDTSVAARSSVELALPVALRFSVVELAWQPAMVIPLGAETSPLLGGSRRVSAKPGLAPLSLVLRFVF
jgi:hypothetical protein